MASNIVLKTYAAGENNQGSVTPQNDALIYQCAVPMNGLFSGGAVTLASANVLHVAAGFGIIGGRFFEILESDIAVQLSSSGTLLGRLYIHLSLTNADEPIEIVPYTGASLPALSGDPTLNITNGDFDMELCQFEINELTISNIVNTYPTITAANNQIRRATAYSVNDFALCQSSSSSLLFICTTAGTTAVQEPSTYATVTDGNTVTDGTVVFKAYSVAGSISKAAQVSDSNDAYDPTKPYEVGDLCIYNNVLYRCITACSAGSWATNQSCFTQTTLTGTVDSLSNLLNGLVYVRKLEFDIVTVNANSVYQYDTVNVEKTNYKLIGIVGMYAGSNAGLTPFINRTSVIGGNTIQFGLINVRNTNITSSSKPELYLLYIKTTAFSS